MSRKRITVIVHRLLGHLSQNGVQSTNNKIVEVGLF